MNTEYPPRHLPPFRPLVPGEQWHRLDFTPEMLPDGWRPLLLGEIPTFEDQYRYPYTGEWTDAPSQGKARSMSNPRRTRRPLPPPPPTFEHGGKVWNSHIPGDPCPVDEDTEVYVLYADSTVGHGCANDFFWELDKAKLKIGYRIPDEPQDETYKLRERIAELELLLEDERKKYIARSQHIADLEYDLRTALTPRPIAEAGPVEEGFVRLFGEFGQNSQLRGVHWVGDTHFIDIRLPEPDPRAEYDRAVAEAGGHYEAWLKAKQEGGAR